MLLPKIALLYIIPLTNLEKAEKDILPSPLNLTKSLATFQQQ
jgi:hypothetical protein